MDHFLIIFPNDFRDADTGMEPRIDVTGVVDSGKKKRDQYVRKFLRKFSMTIK
jgi:hypothetical protein